MPTGSLRLPVTRTRRLGSHAEQALALRGTTTVTVLPLGRHCTGTAALRYHWHTSTAVACAVCTQLELHLRVEVRVNFKLMMTLAFDNA